MARKRTKVSNLQPDWQAVLEHVAKDGGSAVEMRVALGIGRSAWDTLLTDDKSFQATVNKCRDLSQVWWEKLGKALSAGGGGSAAVYIFNMKNRFLWRDQPVEDGNADQPQPVKIEVTVKSASIDKVTTEVGCQL